MSSTKRARKVLSVAMAFVMALSVVVLSGCAGASGSREIELKPVVNSPAIATAGVLKVGVNSGNAPYAGLADNGTIVGIDVDVAAALAQELGLSMELVDLSGKDPNALLENKTIDIVMDVEQTSGSVIRGIQVGPYVVSGPALFTIVNSENIPTVELQALAGTKIAAQKESLSAWSLEELIGTGTADPRESLDAAFQAVVKGEVSYAAADAVVGSYLAVDFPGLACVKILGTPIGVSIGVAGDNTALADALTTALRTLRDNGVLLTVLSKWLGPHSASVVMGTTAVTAQSTTPPTTNPATLPNGELDTGEDLPDAANAGDGGEEYEDYEGYEEEE